MQSYSPRPINTHYPISIFSCKRANKFFFKCWTIPEYKLVKWLNAVITTLFFLSRPVWVECPGDQTDPAVWRGPCAINHGPDRYALLFGFVTLSLLCSFVSIPRYLPPSTKAGGGCGMVLLCPRVQYGDTNIRSAPGQGMSTRPCCILCAERLQWVCPYAWERRDS